jgi:hypothetical protein
MGTDRMLRSGLTMSAVCDAAGISKEGRALLAEDAEARAFIEALVGGEQYGDAIAFLAHGMPSREAIFWAWWCANEVTADDAPEAMRTALSATRAWLKEPTDENRRAAMAAAEAADYGTPAGFAGVAVFFTGDTIGPADAPPAPAGDFAAAKAIGGCVNISAGYDEPEDVPARFRTFIEKGLEIADRTALWSPPADGGPATRKGTD